MNYLAHLYLSHETPEAITGAMLGDFVKGRVPEHWGPEVRRAIALHRAIDRYTDSHPAVVASRALISPERRRFAGILIDVFHDHFLARDWPRYHPRPLAEFTRTVYRVLLPQRARLPERLRRMLPAMAADDWLASYARVEAVDAALRGIARRFRYPERARALGTAVAELERNYAPLAARFEEFFGDLRSYVAGEGRAVRERRAAAPAFTRSSSVDRA
ncbi:MAG TPA: ACP phosphodiesterase [Burkholderiales bacterium]